MGKEAAKQPTTEGSGSAELTIGAIISYFLDPPDGKGNDSNLVSWPPDAFAFGAFILKRSGCYVCLVSGTETQLPPTHNKEKNFDDWQNKIKGTADTWRRSLDQGKDAIPDALKRYWKQIWKNRDVHFANLDLPRHRALRGALFGLVAAADEACHGVGLPHPSKDPGNDQFHSRIGVRLAETGGGTLCKRIAMSRARVLPKTHTPSNGMTIRSLSHHLALCPPGEIDVCWHATPLDHDHQNLNLLLVPWPLTIHPSSFVERKRTHIGARFFSYEIQSAGAIKLIKSLVKKGMKMVGRVDGIILPEMALAPREYEALKGLAFEIGVDFIVCGVGMRGKRGFGQNTLIFCTRPPSYNLRKSGRKVRRLAFRPETIRNKHHRWRLDRKQVAQYGLGGVLAGKWSWWEDIKVNKRQLDFFALHRWLTVCPLICEDLARQDPVAEIVRAVGPNLVIVILMDGPQLPSRWPSRYATVLADDPGCSVLTLTSLGMLQLSKDGHGNSTSRAIALWNDVECGTPRPLELPQNAQALILSLAVDWREEVTADGRRDKGDRKAGYPLFAGVHPIYVDS
jgi:hypothetical protein